ncbi:MAG: OmpH family outer membrane protein [Planctomycetia bacterium]|nr:OmpH family outer membrane protein [Planctomycetia bacterium]
MKARFLTPALVVRIAGLSLALLVGLAASGTAYGQATDGVRVIDVKYIFDHHPRFRSAMDGLKKDFEETAKRLQEEQQAIIKAEAHLKEYIPGSPDYKRVDEDVSRRKAEWGLAAEKQRKEIRTRESEILWNVYAEIQIAVKEYCASNNVGLVVQFNGDPIDPKMPQAVVSGIARQIVYVAPNRDITPIILDAVIRGVRQPVPTRQVVPLPAGQ